MSAIDRVKEEIGLLKLFLAALIAIDISLIGRLAQHYESGSRVLVLAGMAATVVGIGLALWASRLIYRRIRQLEDL